MSINKKDRSSSELQMEDVKIKQVEKINYLRIVITDDWKGYAKIRKRILIAKFVQQKYLVLSNKKVLLVINKAELLCNVGPPI